MTREERDAITYTIHNADTTPRQVILEHPIGEGRKLEEGQKPADTGASHYRFCVAVEPGKTEKFGAKESRPEKSSLFISTLTDNQVAALVEEKTIQPTMEAALPGIIAKKNETNAVDQEIKTRQKEIESINQDQARLRENRKARKGSAEEKLLLQRYTKQLDGQEDRLTELQKEIKDLRMSKTGLQGELDAMVQQIALDETL